MSALRPTGSNAHTGLNFPQAGLRRNAFPPHPGQQNKPSPAPHSGSPYQNQAYTPQQPPAGTYPQHLFTNPTPLNGNVPNGSSRTSQSHITTGVPNPLDVANTRTVQPPRSQMMFPTLGQVVPNQLHHHQQQQAQQQQQQQQLHHQHLSHSSHSLTQPRQQHQHHQSLPQQHAAQQSPQQRPQSQQAQPTPKLQQVQVKPAAPSPPVQQQQLAQIQQQHQQQQQLHQQQHLSQAQQHQFQQHLQQQAQQQAQQHAQQQQQQQQAQQQQQQQAQQAQQQQAQQQQQEQQRQQKQQQQKQYQQQKAAQQLQQQAAQQQAQQQAQQHQHQQTNQQQQQSSQPQQQVHQQAQQISPDLMQYQQPQQQTSQQTPQPAQPKADQNGTEDINMENHEDAENDEDGSASRSDASYFPQQPLGEMMSPPPEGGSYPTLEAVQKSVLRYCTSVGYAIVIGRSKKTVPGLKKVLFVCDRAGKPPSRVSPEFRKRKTSSRKCDCPFGFFAIEQRTQWTIRYRPDPAHLQHNHGPSESPSHHPAARKLDSKMVAAVKQLKENGAGVSETLQILQTENPDCHLLPRDIYNARAAINRNPQKVATGLAENRPAIYSKPHQSPEDRIRADLRRELAKAREDLKKIEAEKDKEIEELKAKLKEKDEMLGEYTRFIDICNQRVMIHRKELSRSEGSPSSGGNPA